MLLFLQCGAVCCCEFWHKNLNIYCSWISATSICIIGFLDLVVIGMGITLTEQHSSIDPEVRARAPKDIDNDGYLLVSKNKRETRTAFQIAFLIFRDTKTRKNVLTSICKSEERRIWKSPHSFHWQWGIKKVNPVPPTGEVFCPCDS